MCRAEPSGGAKEKGSGSCPTLCSVQEPNSPAATAAATAAEAAAAAAAAFAGPGLVDGDVTAIKRLAVEGGDGLVGLGAVGELHEAEAAGAAGVAVHNQRRGGDGSVGLEQLAELVLGRVEREIAYVELHTCFQRAQEEYRCLDLGG